MDKKRADDITDLRRQRERIRRVTIAASLVALVAILASCDALVRRDLASQPAAAGAGQRRLSYVFERVSPTDHRQAHF